MPRLVARSRRDENLGGQKRAEIRGEISAAKIAPRLREIKSRRVKWRDVGGENGAKMNPRRPKTWRESLGGQRENLM